MQYNRSKNIQTKCLNYETQFISQTFSFNACPNTSSNLMDSVVQSLYIKLLTLENALGIFCKNDRKLIEGSYKIYTCTILVYTNSTV